MLNLSPTFPRLQDFATLIEKLQQHKTIDENDIIHYINKIKHLNYNPQSWDDLMLHKVIISYGYFLYFKSSENDQKQALAAALNEVDRKYYGELFQIKEAGLNTADILKSKESIKVDVNSRSAFAAWWSFSFTSGVSAANMAKAFLLARFHPAIIATYLYKHYGKEQKPEENIFTFKEADWTFRTKVLPYIQTIAEITGYLLIAGAITVAISVVLTPLFSGAAIGISLSMTTEVIQITSTYFVFQYIVDLRRQKLDSQKTNFKPANNQPLDQAIIGAKIVQPTTMISNLTKNFVRILEFYQNSKIMKQDQEKIIQNIYNGFDTNGDTTYIYKLKAELLNTVPIELT